MKFKEVLFLVIWLFVGLAINHYILDNEGRKVMLTSGESFSTRRSGHLQNRSRRVSEEIWEELGKDVRELGFEIEELGREIEGEMSEFAEEMENLGVELGGVAEDVGKIIPGPILKGESPGERERNDRDVAEDAGAAGS